MQRLIYLFWWINADALLVLLGNRKREQFLSIFRTLRPKFDEDDGAMDENMFRDFMIAQSKNTFTKAEVDEHLRFLCDDGRLMQADGMLYTID